MYQRIHCKPSWSIQQILSQTKEETFMPGEESFTMLLYKLVVLLK